MSNRLVELRLFHLHLPFRGSFSHAQAQRKGTDTVLVAAQLSDGTIGYGEGLPREYVTGETVSSALYHIKDTLSDVVRPLEPKRFTDVLDRVEQLPFRNSRGQVINSARSAMELAILDVYSRYFRCSLAEQISGWLGHGLFLGPAQAKETIRVSGVLGAGTIAQTARRLQLMRWFGLRNFKLKMGFQGDRDIFEYVYRKLRKPLETGKMTLRIDANGAWDIDTAVAMCQELSMYPVVCVEQPLSPLDRGHLHALAGLSPIPLMADESLLTLEDGKALAQENLVDYFNIRISKNGGLLPSLRLAELAQRYRLGYQLGAMVGESGVLAGAGRVFLRLAVNASFTEICYGTHLLRSDIVKRPVRFGYGGKLPRLAPLGLGTEVDSRKMGTFFMAPVEKIQIE